MYFRFPECQRPKFSKYLRVVAFAYPYLFDNIPLFYRVGLQPCTSEIHVLTQEKTRKHKTVHA